MQNITTITVDKNFDVGESNAIMIGEEVLEILPIDSKEGHLFQFVDVKKKKGAFLRLKRHLTQHAPDVANAAAQKGALHKNRSGKRAGVA